MDLICSKVREHSSTCFFAKFGFLRKYLTDLNISGNLITDFSALNNYRNIRKLNVSKTKISDISPIMKMENIRELKAVHSDLSKADIQRFKKKYPRCEITYY